MLKSLFNRKVLLNLALAILLFIGLIWLTFRWLEYHTNHGKEIIVPQITNMSVQKAIEVLDNIGLKYEVDSFDFDPKYKPFQVLQIYPIAGSHVKVGSPITLKVNPRTFAPVAIPDIIDSYKYRAFTKLKLVGLNVGDTIYVPSIAKDAVLKLKYQGKDIQPGELVPRFSTIDVVIGQGPKQNITVPNLVGLSLGQAKQIIHANLFAPGLFVDENNTIADNDSLTVFYQNPAPGSISDQGIQIDLWASNKTVAEMHRKISELDRMYRRSYYPTPIAPSPTDTIATEKNQDSAKVKTTPPKQPEPEKEKKQTQQKTNHQPKEKKQPKEQKKVIIE